MIKINRKLEEIHNKLIKCFPKAYLTIDISLEKNGNYPATIKIRAYISNHSFKLSTTSFSNYCDSIEGFITHINYEMEGIAGWKPIKELKSRIV